MSNHVTHDESDEDEMHLSLLPAISDSSKAVSAPEDHDVICGRGKSVTHPGNQKFRRMVLARKEEYQQAKRRDEKTRIAYDIVEEIRQGPESSRFLLKDTKSGMWFDVGNVYAREKVSHALRSRPNEERRRKPKPKKKLARKPEVPPEFEGKVQALIRDQQALLKSMIEKEIFPGTHFDFADGSKARA